MWNAEMDCDDGVLYALLDSCTGVPWIDWF